MSMKIAFFGTGDFSKNVLRSLLQDESLDVCYVVSQRDKPVGRKKILEKTPVKLVAEEFQIDIDQPDNLRKDGGFLQKLESLKLDFIVVVAYGKIVPKRVLEAAKYGCINLHGSVLPAYRGASPIQESIKNGDTQTGLTLMYMSKGMDEGDILLTEEVSIDKDDTTEDIFKKFENIGPELIVKGLEGIMSGVLIGKPQDDEKATYCGKINKQDGEVDFSASAESIYNQFRAYYNWPGIFTYYKGVKLQIEECSFEDYFDVYDDVFEIGAVCQIGEGKEKKIGVLCNKGFLILKQVKLAGKRSMDILSFINGNKDFLDYKF